jgi:cytoskeletal protein RodZ
LHRAERAAVRHNRHVFEIGASLREARIKRGLSAADIQKAIRIRDRYLQALEEERWELLPGDAYVKGFLRTYADFLGLDANLYVDEYNSRFARHDEPPLSHQPLAQTGPALGGIGLLRPLLAIAAIVAIVAGVAAWQLNRPSKTAQSTTANTTTTSGTTTGGSTTQHKKKSKKPPPVALPTRAVLVAARGNCWLWVRSGGAGGTTVYEQTLPHGQTLHLALAHGPLWIELGDPRSLDIHLGGKLVHGLPTTAGSTILLTGRGFKPA